MKSLRQLQILPRWRTNCAISAAHSPRVRLRQLNSLQCARPLSDCVAATVRNRCEANVEFPKNSWDLSPPLSVEICVREIQSIPEASLLTQGHCNRYRSSLAGCGTIDAGIRVVWGTAIAFRKVGSERV